MAPKFPIIGNGSPISAHFDQLLVPHYYWGGGANSECLTRTDVKITIQEHFGVYDKPPSGKIKGRSTLWIQNIGTIF
jgi:hypothetical protein